MSEERETGDEEAQGTGGKWLPAMAMDVLFLDGRVVKHGSLNARDNVLVQFVNLGGGEEVALLVKETVLDAEGKELAPKIVKDSIYPVRNFMRATVLRRERDDG